jgi:hypothetical protein
MPVKGCAETQLTFPALVWRLFSGGLLIERNELLQVALRNKTKPSEYDWLANARKSGLRLEALALGVGNTHLCPESA